MISSKLRAQSKVKIWGDNMKSKIINKEPEQPEIKYPCLMENIKGRVFLMGSEEDGFMVYSGVEGGAQYLGNIADGWGIPDFKPFTGKLELSND